MKEKVKDNRPYRGGGKGGITPPEALRGGVLPLPLRLSPKWSQTAHFPRLKVLIALIALLRASCRVNKNDNTRSISAKLVCQTCIGWGDSEERLI